MDWAQAHGVQTHSFFEQYVAQCYYLDHVAANEIRNAEMTKLEWESKEAFLRRIETLCQTAVAQAYNKPLPGPVSVRPFGSLMSGFATKGSDMDLALGFIHAETSSWEQIYPLDRDIPRLLEKALLDAGLGARLLTRTRVPILKVCESPTPELYHALREARQKWDDLPEEEKYPANTNSAEAADDGDEDAESGIKPNSSKESPQQQILGATNPKEHIDGQDVHRSGQAVDAIAPKPSSQDETPAAGPDVPEQSTADKAKVRLPRPPKGEKPWLREKALGPLDFPKKGIGNQCDITFSNPLALHNTHLLYCYSLCDSRVKPMVLFVKAWAKRRKINNPYSGTLSSYGYVLMVLHFLINVASPPVLPNLQQYGSAPSITVQGYEVKFWRDSARMMQGFWRSQNRETLGSLLRTFFHYYAGMERTINVPDQPRRVQPFYWTQEVLSIRQFGGVVSKASKGWTGAKTTETDDRTVRHRYLFAIEDPFETDHNVARTVTHRGIIAIRDEFRRAFRILRAVGRRECPEGELFDEVIDEISSPSGSPKPILSIESEARRRAEAEMQMKAALGMMKNMSLEQQGAALNTTSVESFDVQQEEAAKARAPVVRLPPPVAYAGA